MSVLRLSQKERLLSFGLNLQVGLNDPCVEGSVTQGWVKRRFWIVTHVWEQKKAPSVLFFSPAPDAFCMWKIEQKHVSLFWLYA